jgi:dTDP-4-amino-4,6-dideoxygalactose transaminase
MSSRIDYTKPSISELEVAYAIDAARNGWGSVATNTSPADWGSSYKNSEKLMVDLKESIPVTQPYLPPLEEFIPYLQQIWESRKLTNNGPFHQQFEAALQDYLGVKHISLFANGTLALVVALQALRITGEVITTPFSFVATTHALHWNGIEPVFVDIDPETLNLDPNRIEAAITPRTTAILPVHVYGNPCDLDAIERIADTYGLKVIYDAAHAFGVKRNGISILNAGDLSILSFHATKVFNTFEGGAIVCHDEKTKHRIDFLKNFGFADEVTVVAPGINAKMNEVQAAFGLVQLKHLPEVLSRRAEIDRCYREALVDVPGIRLHKVADDVVWNQAYFPILVEPLYPLSRDDLYSFMRTHNIHVRRYFYPLISQFPTYRGLRSSARENLPVSKRITEQVLCLPIFSDLARFDQEKVISILKENVHFYK